MDDDAIWQGLLDRRPTSLDRLEALVGPVGGETDPDFGWWIVPAVRVDADGRSGVLVQFEDVPVLRAHLMERQHASLASYRVVLATGRRPCEAALREQYGAPTTHRVGTDTVLAFHPFYLVEADGDRLDLAWCYERPDFTLPTRAPLDEQVRAEVLATMAEKVAAHDTIAEADEYRHSLPEAAGFFTQARMQGNRWRLEVKPPLVAPTLCEACGWSRPYAVSGDVHLQTWHIWLRPEDDDRQSGHVLLERTALGAWWVDAELSGWPAGETALGMGPSPAHALSEHDEVVSLTFSHDDISSYPDQAPQDAAHIDQLEPARFPTSPCSYDEATEAQRKP